MKPYYQDDFVTLYRGECLDVMSDWLSEFASPDFGQIVVTSPPYNMGLVPGGNGRGMYRPGASRKGGRFREGYDGSVDDAMPQDEYDELRRDELAIMWDLIPEDGAIYWNHRQRVEHGVARLPLGMDFGIPLRQIITLDRMRGIGPSLRHYACVAEWLFMFAKPEFKLPDHAASGGGDIWRVGVTPKAEKFGHPAPFPRAVPERVIATTEARSVLDPFAGTGTTLVAAKHAGIRAVGIELSERYCDLIATRLASTHPQYALDLTSV